MLQIASPMEPLSSLNPWGVPLLGMPGMTARPADEDGLAQLIAPFFHASNLERRSDDGQFRNTISGLQLGGVGLMAIRNNALVSSGVAANGINLLVGYRHPAFFRVEGSEFQVLEQPFLLPLCPYDYWADEVEGLMVSLDSERLISVAMAMAANSTDLFRHLLEASLQRPQMIDLAQGRSRQHFATLKHTLWLADRALREGDGLSPMLALDDLLTRLVVLLLLPELDGEDSTSEAQPLLGAQPSAEPTAADQTLNELIDWVLSDLQRPLRLSDLEARSGYARRTLQKYFHGRFGMGPMQWIRRQRLHHARQLIETSGGLIKIGAIAQSCGYPNPAAFSRDFHEVFGERPSDLMRQQTPAGCPRMHSAS